MEQLARSGSPTSAGEAMVTIVPVRRKGSPPGLPDSEWNQRLGGGSVVPAAPPEIFRSSSAERWTVSEVFVSGLVSGLVSDLRSVLSVFFSAMIGSFGNAGLSLPWIIRNTKPKPYTDVWHFASFSIPTATYPGESGPTRGRQPHRGSLNGREGNALSKSRILMSSRSRSGPKLRFLMILSRSLKPRPRASRRAAAACS